MRFLSWSLILFQFFLINVFLPVHTRGAITLTEKPLCAACVPPPASLPSQPSCCASGRSDSAHCPPTAPTPEDRKCCAVCYVGSIYIPAEPVSIQLDLFELIRLSHDLAVAQVVSLDYPTPFWPVGPPVTA